MEHNQYVKNAKARESGVILLWKLDALKWQTFQCNTITCLEHSISDFVYIC